MTNREKRDPVQKAFGKMLLSLLVCVFTLVTYLNFSFSWFAENRNSGAAGLSITTMERDAIITSVECYHVTDITAEGLYVFDTALPAESLPTYDINGLNTNLYKDAVVIKFTFSADTANYAYEYAASLTAPSAFFSAGVENKLSNAVQFWPGTVSGSTFTPDPTLEDAVSFLTHPAKITADANVTKTPNPIHIGDLPGGTNTAYFVMEYDRVVVQHICDQRSLAADSQVASEYRPDIAVYIQKKGVE